MRKIGKGILNFMREDYSFTASIGAGLCAAVVLPLTFELSGLAKHFQEYYARSNEATYELRKEYFGEAIANRSRNGVKYYRIFTDFAAGSFGYFAGTIAGLRISTKIVERRIKKRR